MAMIDQPKSALVSCDICGKQFTLNINEDTGVFSTAISGRWLRKGLSFHPIADYTLAVSYDDVCDCCQKFIGEAVHGAIAALKEASSTKE